ncbi:pyridoxamine 5'-phosphate oxidase family protein [Subtercola frigoramans]|uniref:pyridoxamine 5'-phosphate oxidase family protein n=1 Tax=Subtercola frigoramans TaxID=120298 RepID=UPI00195F953D|nr:pyridoxamine 5'-phosphate oxidase family protein [Subtercola frigoramans]
MSSFTDEPITVLSAEECWAVLRRTTVGRLAVSVVGQPDVFPINFFVDDHSILMRTGQGSKLLEATINPLVAFEADSVDRSHGWSVVVKGTARVLDTESEELAAARLPLESWLPTSKQVYLRIEPAEIAGRRFAFGGEAPVGFSEL